MTLEFWNFGFKLIFKCTFKKKYKKRFGNRSIRKIIVWKFSFFFWKNKKDIFNQVILCVTPFPAIINFPTVFFLNFYYYQRILIAKENIVLNFKFVIKSKFSSEKRRIDKNSLAFPNSKSITHHAPKAEI